MKLSYKSAGVDISKGEEFVNRIKPLVKKTFTNEVLRGLGSFGAFYKPQLQKFKNPVFVSSVDSVGTKVKIAAALGKYDTIGEDIVNHCVNDIAVCGAVPLYFLDYYATGKLDVKASVELVKGLVRGCKKNNCSLIGGETAEMPGIYAGKDFDIAGSITGIVDKSRIVNYSKVKKGDILVGIPSTGLHTNGYSLARKIFDTGKKLNSSFDDSGITAGNALLKVHRSYLDIIQSSLKSFNIKSISHITGGGIEGNTRRVIPNDRNLEIDWGSWKIPAIFTTMQKKGGVSIKDMRKTFNLGIGLVFIVAKKDVNNFINFLKKKKEKSYLIGSIS